MTSEVYNQGKRSRYYTHINDAIDGLVVPILWGRRDGSGPHHLFGAETARTDLCLYDLTTDLDTHGMYIGIPSPFRLVVGVAYVVSNYGSLPAYIANSTHRISLLLAGPLLQLNVKN